jgi:hypothetical protein
MVVWWCGGVVVWWCGGVVVWWCGGVVFIANAIYIHPFRIVNGGFCPNRSCAWHIACPVSHRGEGRMRLACRLNR